jgi:hypothetical protein
METAFNSKAMATAPTSTLRKNPRKELPPYPYSTTVKV